MRKIIQILIVVISTYSMALAQDKVTIKSNPLKTNIEVGEHKQFLNCDFVVQNNTKDTLTLSKIMVTVFDKNKKVLHQRFLDNNGTAPSIQTLPNRVFNGKGTKLIFNPFEEFDIALPLNQIEFQFTFSTSELPLP